MAKMINHLPKLFDPSNTSDREIKNFPLEGILGIDCPPQNTNNLFKPYYWPRFAPFYNVTQHQIDNYKTTLQLAWIWFCDTYLEKDSHATLILKFGTLIQQPPFQKTRKPRLVLSITTDESGHADQIFLTTIFEKILTSSQFPFDFHHVIGQRIHNNHIVSDGFILTKHPFEQSSNHQLLRAKHLFDPLADKLNLLCQKK